MDFSPDCKLIVAARENPDLQVRHPIRIFEVTTGKELSAFGHNGWIRALAFSPDGNTVVVAYSRATIGLWDRTTGKRVAWFRTGQWEIRSLAFSPDGKWLFSGGDDGNICGWHVSR